MKKIIFFTLFSFLVHFSFSQSFFKPEVRPKFNTKAGTTTPVTTTQNVIRPVINLASYAVPNNLGLTGVGVSYQHQQWSVDKDRWDVVWSINALTWYSTQNTVLYGLAVGALNNLILVGVATDSKIIYGTIGIGVNLN